MKKSYINRVSKKRQAQLPKYCALIKRLRKDNKGELSGKSPTWESNYLAEPHHIQGRIGSLFLDPFNLILLTREEHTIEELHLEGCHTKEELLDIVRPIRLKQGFKEHKRGGEQ